MTDKTNTMRMLDARGVPYETYTFSPDIRSAEEVAQVVDLPASQVYKTLFPTTFIVTLCRGK
jgi:prolyl-tRNA editing enzyme YbaK/EbsC (Cys-tRNA(Pro) deacylase)